MGKRQEVRMPTRIQVSRGGKGHKRQERENQSISGYFPADASRNRKLRELHDPTVAASADTVEIGYVGF